MGSACYIYAIVPAAERLPAGLAGLDGGPLWTVAARGLGAVVSTPGVSPAQPTVDRLLCHEAVVEAIGRAVPALPVRFGTVLADAATVTHALDERADILTGDLRRVGSKVELGVTVLALTEDGAASADHAAGAERTGIVSLARATGAGGTYLRARLGQHARETEEHARGAALAELLDAAFGPLVVERRARVCPAPRLLLRAQYLLEPSSVEGCQRRFDEVRRAWRQTQPDLRCLLSGPWPPYSFVTTRRDDRQAGSAVGADQMPRALSALLGPAWLARIL